MNTNVLKILEEITAVINMPKITNRNTANYVTKWHKDIGDYIKKGDVIADVETKQLLLEFESNETGYLLYKGCKEGKKIKINNVLAIICKHKK